MSRWKAALIHLSISVAVGALALALFLLVWYPPPYFHAAGADTLAILMVGVDITLGPLITLVIFRSGKPGLKFDLVVIALLQAGALIYGSYIVAASRPVFLVAAVDRFKLVSAADLDPADLAAARDDQFRTLSWTGARLVGVAMPTEPNEARDLMFSGAGGKDIEKYPKYFINYDTGAEAFLKAGKTMDELRRKHPESGALIDAAVHAGGGNESDLVWFPLTAREHDLVMLVSTHTRQPVKAIAVDPW